MSKKIICVICPKGCEMTMETGIEGKATWSGQGCHKGAKYADQELQSPMRVLTTTVSCIKGSDKRVSVRSREALPLDLVFEAMAIMKATTLTAPIKVGDVVVENILDTGVDMIATSNNLI